MPVKHYLKCQANYYDATERGEKNFEVRRDDRGFQKGDQVILMRMGDKPSNKNSVEHDSDGKVKHAIQREILYVLTGGQFGIEPGYVVLGLQQ